MNDLATQFGLTQEERKELLPSGVDRVFDNRVGWARTYLKKAMLIEYPRRGYFKVTDRGQKVLAAGPPLINAAFLRQFPEFLEFHSPKAQPGELPISDLASESSDTPAEAIEAGYVRLRRELEADVLLKVKACSPEFFESLVVELLTTMGYGGSRADAGKAIGKSGDGGIDGVIKEDKLGLDLLYIQAKRWDTTTVGSPEIQKFVGALYGRKAKKGVFITTSSFSRAAIDYVANLDSKVILIDGTQLAQLMFDHNVGVSTVSRFEIKRIDADFFEEDAAPLSAAGAKG
jgi:restriction system protein